MKTYKEEGLIEIVRNVISKTFSNAESIKTKFQAILEKEYKSKYKGLPTDNEIRENTLAMANYFYGRLSYITNETIIQSLSQELKKNNYKEGINIEDYKNYFNELAINLVKGYIQYEIKRINKKK